MSLHPTQTKFRRRALVASRAALARLISAALSRLPRLEPAYLRVSRPVARLPMAAGLIAAINDDLIERLNRSARPYRRLPVGGMPLWLDITDGTARVHYFYGEPYEPALVAHLSNRLREGDVFVDIGANIGFFTVLAARLVGPSGRVIAFEPNPDARRALVDLATRNRVEHLIDIVPAALSDAAAAEQPLFLTDSSALSTLDPTRSPVRAEADFGRTVLVQVTTLDDWMSARPDLASRIAAIKIDVEGLEDHVLAGSERTLAACPSADIVLETATGSAADRRLRSAGFGAAPLDVYDESHQYGNHVYRRRPAEGA